MVMILTIHDIDEVLNNPQKNVYVREKLASIGETVISLIEDNSCFDGYCFEVRYPTGFITRFDMSFGYDNLISELTSESDVSKMSYSEFCETLADDTFDRFKTVLSEDSFFVFKDEHTGRYYYLEGGSNDASDFFEVYPVSFLTYNVTHDIKIKDGEKLAFLFDCICCGEEVSDETIKYWWFDKKEHNI